MLQLETTKALEEFQVCVRSKDDLNQAAINFARSQGEYERATAELISSANALTDHLCGWGQETIESLKKPGSADVSDSRVILQITCFAEVVRELLRQAESYWNEDELVSAKCFMEQARRVAETLYSVQRAWPWVNLQQIDEARSDYETGKLMDLETFTNGLRGV